MAARNCARGLRTSDGPRVLWQMTSAVDRILHHSGEIIEVSFLLVSTTENCAFDTVCDAVLLAESICERLFLMAGLSHSVIPDAVSTLGKRHLYTVHSVFSVDDDGREICDGDVTQTVSTPSAVMTCDARFCGDRHRHCRAH